MVVWHHGGVAQVIDLVSGIPGVRVLAQGPAEAGVGEGKGGGSLMQGAQDSSGS